MRIDTSCDLGALESDWDAVADATNAAPFVRPGWFRAWADAFAPGALEVVTATDGRRVMGFAALCRSRGGLRSATNYHTPEFGLVAADDPTRRALSAAVFERADRSLAMAYVPSDGPDDAAIEAEARRRGWRTLSRVEPSPFVDLSIGWDAYERGLSSNLRNDARRRRRRLGEAGALELDVRTGDERLGELLEEGFRLEGSGWKDAQGTAIASAAETLAFYGDVARWAAARGWLRLSFLRLDGRAIAFHYDLEAAGVVYHLKGGYDPEFGRFSPGKVLHHLKLERSFAAGLSRYDFLGGTEGYKAQFATGARDLRIVRAFAPTAAGRTEHAVYRYARPLAKRARSLVHAGGA